MTDPQKLPHVLIIGGGFGGLRCAQKLAHAPVRVTLVDRRNHHTFAPLLYQVATANMMAETIAVPLRGVLGRQKNASVRLGEVRKVALADKQVELACGTRLDYDYVVIAAGARTSFFGHDEWEQHTVGLKSVEDAYAIRRRVQLAFEAAELEDGAEARRRLLTFVVVGGGPTGVEMAGAMAELTRKILARDCRKVRPEDVRLLLLEAAPRLLLPFHPNLAEKARKDLVALGVEVVVGKGVTKIDAGGVHLGEEYIASDLMVWGAGVAPVALARAIDGLPATQRGFIPVQQDCSLEGHPEAFAIGDVAAFIPEAAEKAAAASGQKPRPLPGVAPVAQQQGAFVADAIARTLAGKPRKQFHYFDKGSMAIVGTAKAVLEVRKLRMSGLVAWLGWILVHVLQLVTFRNRAYVTFDFLWSSLCRTRGGRLIVGRLGGGRDGPGHDEAARYEQVPSRMEAPPAAEADIGPKAGWNKNEAPSKA